MESRDEQRNINTEPENDKIEPSHYYKFERLPEKKSWFRSKKSNVMLQYLGYFTCFFVLTVFSIMFCIYYIEMINMKSEYKITHLQEMTLLQEIRHTMNENDKSKFNLLHRAFDKNLTIKNPQHLNHQRTNFLPNARKFDCYPENDVSQNKCEDRGCVWQSLSMTKEISLNVPYCYYPENWHIYKLQESYQNENKFRGKLKLVGKSPYGNDIPEVKIETYEINDEILEVKMFDPHKKRYEPPIPIREPTYESQGTSNKRYVFSVDTFAKKLPGFSVTRVSDNTVIFNSIGVGGFMYADQFLQISSILPSENIYGLGERQTSLKLNTNWQLLTFFNSDQAPVEQRPLYGTHPFYLVVEDNGNCHGVLFLNSNPMDVILQPTPAITFRTIGGIFDFYFFMGPTPEDVLKQYSTVVGKPFLPPYWSLGFHLSKYGLKTLDDIRKLWNRTRAADIPFDTQWSDLDYMDKKNDFTYDKNKYKNLPHFVNELHEVGMHYIPIIDAGISGSDENGTYLPYLEGLREDILIKDADTKKPFIGKVWNLNSTTWPDHYNPKTKNYYYKMMKMLHDDVAFDGAWIDMNEPSNFYDGTIKGCDSNTLDYPPYLPNVNDGLLAKKTLCMNAQHYVGKHYDLHNTYGTSQAISTNYALTKIRNKRPFVISRSTWVGHGFYAGHWTGDVFSTWHDMKMSIPAILSMAFYQIPMVGADICGFNGNTTIALCNRWSQLGAFYPFSRNHNTDDAIDQDPVSMGNSVVISAKRALRIRYFLLPYLYTLFYRAHAFGEPVIRPLFFEFIEDTTTYNIDTTFLWGKHLLIIPILEESAKKINAYIPRGVWYDFHTRSQMYSIGSYHDFETEPDIMPILIRGGIVIPAQKESVTTTESRKNPFILLAALDIFNEAFGELYWDDGDNLDSISSENYRWIQFTIQNSTLKSVNEKGKYNGDMWLDTIQIMGIQKSVKCVSLNGANVDFEYIKPNSVLFVDKIRINLKQNFIFTWSSNADECHKVIHDGYRKQIINEDNEQTIQENTEMPIYYNISTNLNVNFIIVCFFIIISYVS